MATLSAKKIQEALKKAQNVGRVEEKLTIDGCSVVLQSLRPDEYAIVQDDIAEIPEGIGYLNAFKREHLARSVCEFNEVDLRPVHFVEVDVEEIDEKTKQPVIKTIKVERHVFVRDYVLGSWGREAIDIAFRKFNDLIGTAEKEAAAGVHFVTPEESPEDKYRKLLTDAKEIEGGLPLEMTAKIREDLGFLVKSPEAVEQLASLDQLAVERQQAQAPAATPEPVPEPAQPTPKARPVQRAAVPVPQPAPPQPRPLPQDGQPSPEEIMQARQPLNQRNVAIPSPAMQANPLVPPTTATMAKSAQIAALESLESFEPTPAVQGGSQLAPAVQGGSQIVAATPGGDRTPMEISAPLQKVNPTEAERIFEQPPVAGINPRFRRPPQF